MQTTEGLRGLPQDGELGSWMRSDPSSQFSEQGLG